MSEFIKISMEQAIRMATATIRCDYDEKRRCKIVDEIIEAWKYYGYIHGYEKQENPNESEQPLHEGGRG